jgi:hypothetical protein
MTELTASSGYAQQLWDNTSKNFVDNYNEAYETEISAGENGIMSVLELYDLLSTITDKNSDQYKDIEAAIKIGERAAELTGKAMDAAYQLIDLQIKIFEAGYENAESWYKVEKDRLKTIEEIHEEIWKEIKLYI